MFTISAAPLDDIFIAAEQLQELSYSQQNQNWITETAQLHNQPTKHRMFEQKHQSRN